MAKKEKISNVIRDFGESGRFGEYNENVGGGDSPHPKDPNQRAPGVNSSYRKAHNKTEQPRTDDGKFTYKSANGQKIDPKYGPSRGKTVNPVLTGGKNGVYIDEVKEQFEAKEGFYWDKYKDSWYQSGSEAMLEERKGRKHSWHTHISGKEIWEVAKEFNDKVGEFKGESDVFGEIKKGRRSLEEKAAIEGAKKDKKKYSYVKDKEDDSIKKFRKTPTEGAEPEQEAKEEKTQPIIPSTPIPSTDIDDKRKALSDILKGQGVDINALSDDKINQLADKFLEKEKKETPKTPEESKPSNENLDSLAQRLIKQYPHSEKDIVKMQNQIKSNSRSTKKNSAENISDYLAFVLQHDSYTWNDKLDIIDEIVNKKGDYADDSYLDEELDNRRFKEWRKVYKSKESPQAQKVRAMGFTGE